MERRIHANIQNPNRIAHSAQIEIDNEQQELMRQRVPVCQPFFWGNEKVYVSAALDSGWISSQGHFLDQFESAFAQKLGVKFAVAVTSGTAALHLALDVLEIGSGDEVIVPDFTMMAPVFALIHERSIPIPVDADETWNIDPDRIERAITSRTKAIVVVHTYGHPARVDVIAGIAQRHGLLLIEDAAEALGSELNGRQVGSFGDIACFSFYANKVVTTGEGGMLVTSNPRFFELAKWKRNMCFGIDLETHFTHRSIGHNFRMTNLQAALGLAQLEHLDAATRAKIEIADQYRMGLEGVRGLTLPPRSTWGTNVYWVFGILVEDEFGVSRSELQERLGLERIETRRFFTPLHLQPFFALPELAANYPQADRLFRRGLYLPSFIGMGEECIGRVSETVREIQRNEIA